MESTKLKPQRPCMGSVDWVDIDKIKDEKSLRDCRKPTGSDDLSSEPNQ